MCISVLKCGSERAPEMPELVFLVLDLGGELNRPWGRGGSICDGLSKLAGLECVSVHLSIHGHTPSRTNMCLLALSGREGMGPGPAFLRKQTGSTQA